MPEGVTAEPEEVPLIDAAAHPPAESYGSAPQVEQQQRPEEQQPPEQQAMLTGPFYSDEVQKRLTGQWSDGLFDCLTDTWTCFVCIIPLFGCAGLVYQTVSRLPVKYRKMTMCGCSDPSGTTLLYFLLMPFNAMSFLLVGGCFVHKLTTAVSARYQMQEQTTFLQSWICQPCQLARLARHTGRAQGFIK